MPVKIFFCYAHEDETLLKKLKSHLKPLQRDGLLMYGMTGILMQEQNGNG